MKKHFLKCILKKYNLPSTNYSTVSKKYYKSVVGLEIHAQISTKTKLFSGAETDFSSPVNTNVSLFDAAIPGTLPVLNRRCVEAGVLTALALSCNVNAVSYFDRKHYFYADLPAGYQITQQRAPLANDGLINFEVFTPGVHKKPYTKTSKIIQIQLEQDSGKSLHDDEEKLSLVDLNRAGIPLMELVFEPDLTDGEEAAALVKELMTILLRLETCSCKMEEGALRVDANVSIHEENQPLGQRTEIKNIGSVRGIASAINYEIHRQLGLIQKGQIIENETRSWDSETKTTVAMRDKEKKQDYRFMPEPNLPPLQLKMPGVPTIFPGLVDVETLKNSLPELPEETRIRLQETFSVSKEVVIILVNEPILLKHFESICEDSNRNSKLVANVLINELLTTLNKNKIQLEECKMSSNILGEIIDLIESKKINLLTTRKVLNEILINNDKESPIEIVTKNNWIQITDEEEIMKICKDCIERNSNLVKKYKSGKTKIFGALLGDIANITEQRVDMGTVTRILKEMLK